MKKILLAFLISTQAFAGNAYRFPSVLVSQSANPGSASSLLEVDSTTQGFLAPRMTTTQRNAIASPAEGLLVYDTTLHEYFGYQNGAWAKIGGPLTSGDIPSLSASTITSGTFTVAQTTVAAQAISALAIDWTTGQAFTKTLSANSTFTWSGMTSGQTIVVRLTNTASNYTVTWPTVKWPSAVTPVQTIGAASDVYTFFYDGANVFGSVVQNF